MKYFNIKTNYGVETIDQLYITELKRLKSEYRLSGMDIYLSQRATKEWYN